MLGQNWIAASANVGQQPRFPRGLRKPLHVLVQPDGHAPLALSALLYSRQFVILYHSLSSLPPSFALISRSYQSADHRFAQQIPLYLQLRQQ